MMCALKKQDALRRIETWRTRLHAKWQTGKPKNDTRGSLRAGNRELDARVEEIQLQYGDKCSGITPEECVLDTDLDRLGRRLLHFPRLLHPCRKPMCPAPSPPPEPECPCPGKEPETGEEATTGGPPPPPSGEPSPEANESASSAPNQSAQNETGERPAQEEKTAPAPPPPTPPPPEGSSEPVLPDWASYISFEVPSPRRCIEVTLESLIYYGIPWHYTMKGAIAGLVRAKKVPPPGPTPWRVAGFALTCGWVKAVPPVAATQCFIGDDWIDWADRVGTKVIRPGARPTLGRQLHPDPAYRMAAYSEEKIPGLTGRWHQADHLLESTKADMVAGDFAPGTNAVYRTGWAYGVLWCVLRQRPIFPFSDSAMAKRMYEEELLGFAAYETVITKNKPPAIKGKWMSIRNENLRRGIDDPLKNRPRLWRGYNTLRRWAGPVLRRYPATVGMVRWMTERLQEGPEALAVAACVQICWFYLLRIGEATAYVGEDDTYSRALHDSQIEMRYLGEALRHIVGQGWIRARDGAKSPPPDFMTLRIESNKTEQYGGGGSRGHGMSGDDLTCPVLSMTKHLQTRNFNGGSIDDRVTFRFDKANKPIRRADIQAWLQLAARARGANHRRMNTHSLRMGGASALYGATRDMTVVKRWGNWRGKAADLYAFDPIIGVQDDARGMIAAGEQYLA